LAILLASNYVVAAWAQETPAPEAEAAPTSTSGAASPHAGGFWERDVMTGDWGGRRTALENAGVLIGLDSINEILGNPSGGVRRGAVYEGRFEALLTLDLNKVLSWPDATFHTNAYQINGRGLSANYLGNNFLTASNIEAARSTRLFDLWVEQLLWQGTVSVRVGQIAADDEFFISQYASNFINATFGWPAIVSADLPSGGLAYPLATPGARFKYSPTSEITLQVGLFNGNPAGPGTGNPQQRDASGTSFRIGDGSFVIAEASCPRNQESGTMGVPASYKLGAWFHSGSFPDQRFDSSGQSLAAPTSTGVPATHNGNYGFYAVFDQMIWRKPDTTDQGLSFFARAGTARSDRNPLTLYGDLGVTLKGALPGRDDDILAVALATAAISQHARALDADRRRFSGIENPIRDSESVLELTYRYQLAPSWTLQPDFQFIRHPGAGATLTTVLPSMRPIPNATVLGFRSQVLF
jgi:porin